MNSPPSSEPPRVIVQPSGNSQGLNLAIGCIIGFLAFLAVSLIAWAIVVANRPAF